MDSHPGNVVAPDLDLAGVNPDPYVEVERSKGVSDRLGTFDGAPGAVEGGHEAIADGVDFTAAEAPDLSTHALVMAVKEISPSAIAQPGRPVRGTHDVSEQDCRQ